MVYDTVVTRNRATPDDDMSRDRVIEMNASRDAVMSAIPARRDGDIVADIRNENDTKPGMSLEGGSVESTEAACGADRW